MFSKALFKQSCKANGIMWAIITFAVCFMLACVMLISGSGNIGETKNAIQYTIVKKEIESLFENRAIKYYDFSADSLEWFDRSYTTNATETLTYLGWLGKMPQREESDTDETYAAKIQAWNALKPDTGKFGLAGKEFVTAVEAWQNRMPTLEGCGGDPAKYAEAMKTWQEQSPATVNNAVAIAYKRTLTDLNVYAVEKADAMNARAQEEKGKDAVLFDAQEYSSLVMCVLYPEGVDKVDNYYNEIAGKGETVPDRYDVTSLTEQIAASLQTGEENTFVSSKERAEYRLDRAESLSSAFLAYNMTSESTVETLVGQLSSYGVDAEKYASFGYDYASVKHIGVTGEITYRNRAEYEKNEIAKKYTDSEGKITDVAAYEKEVAAKKAELENEITASLLSALPEAVSSALKEVGAMDLFGLVVGSIFYKLAGLLLPIIYMIMASNNLIAGQVDSGSMAYVLSTSTKRKTVVFTQALYLIGSLLAMFCLTTITGCVCLAILPEGIGMTYSQLILLNVGAFCVLLCLSGLNFFTSCVFDRSKRSMAIGGGLSIFALVAAMLGLFGSPIIPSVVRLASLNAFNYVTVISLFDVISILDCTTAFVWKFVVLAVAGLICYVIGGLRFEKKDLPL